MSKPYKAKSLSGAQARVRQLVRVNAGMMQLLDEFDHERKQLALLASKTPQFFNPLVAMEAERIRDRILKQMGWQP